MHRSFHSNIPKGRYCSQFTVPVGPLGHRSIAADKEKTKEGRKEMDEEGVTRQSQISRIQIADRNSSDSRHHDQEARQYVQYGGH